MLKRRELLQYSGGLLALSCLPAYPRRSIANEFVTTVTRFDGLLSDQHIISAISDRRKARGHLALKVLQNDTEILIIEERRSVSSQQVSYKKLEL